MKCAVTRPLKPTTSSWSWYIFSYFRSSLLASPNTHEAAKSSAYCFRREDGDKLGRTEKTTYF